MSRPKTHYSVVVRNHLSGEALRVELVDLPFVGGRSFRLRVNGRWAEKIPVGSKSTVLANDAGSMSHPPLAHLGQHRGFAAHRDFLRPPAIDPQAEGAPADER